jgi:hypothetical protein
MAALPEPTRPPEPTTVAVAEPPAGTAAALTDDATSAIGTTTVAAPVPAPSPPAEPESIEATPATVVAPLPEPTRQPEPTAAAQPTEALATDSRHVPDPSANAAAPVPGIETIPVSSIPAVDDAPIPRPKPQLALADPQSASEKPAEQQTRAAQPQRVKAKAKPRRHAALSRRIKRPLPPPTTFESRRGQFPFFDNGAIGDAGAFSQQGNWSGRPEPATDQTKAGRPQWRGYAIQPPTTSPR